MVSSAAAIIVSLAISAIPTQDYRTFTTLEMPGSVAQYGTCPLGVDRTSIVGIYYTADSRSHGFLYNGSSWTSLDYPGAVETCAYGVSGSRIIGTYVDASLQTHGFLYDGSAWRSLDVPGGEQTMAFGIDGETIVGYYMQPNGYGASARGFVYDGSTYTMLQNPAAAFSFAMDIEAGRILVHSAKDDGSTYNSLYDGTGWRDLAFPAGTAYGISGNQIVASDLKHSYMLDGTDLTCLDVPGAQVTVVHGISNGTVVGRYHTGGVVHGFVATVPEPLSIVLLAVGGLLLGRRRT
ncbi:MAG TPA: hypothetical protein VHP11_11090 [Tepidisphaeraceae bacterium]|nr:hypothetical protein [Tepidisphaeraceae bacterium]